MVDPCASLIVSGVLGTSAAWDQPPQVVAEVASCSPGKLTTSLLDTVSTLMVAHLLLLFSCVKQLKELEIHKQTHSHLA